MLSCPASGSLIKIQDKNSVKINLKDNNIYSPVNGTVVDMCGNYIILRNEFDNDIKIELFTRCDSIKNFVTMNQRIDRYSELFKIKKMKKNSDYLILTVIDDNVDVIVTKKTNLQAKDYLLAII